MSKSMSADSRIKLLALLTSALGSATLGVRTFAAEPVRSAPRDPYPLTDTLLWQFAARKWHGTSEKPGGITLVTPDRNGAADAVPEYRLRNWKLGLIEKLPVPKGPFRIALGANATNELLKEFSRLKTLEALDLSYCSNVTDVGLKPLAGLSELKVLNLSVTHLTGAGLKELSALKQLQSLDLMCDDITDAALKELSGFQRLRILRLAATHVTDAGLKKLSTLRDLRVLGSHRMQDY